MKSRPVRACGLKLYIDIIKTLQPSSRPVRACGLKQLINQPILMPVKRHAPCGRVD